MAFYNHEIGYLNSFFEKDTGKQTEGFFDIINENNSHLTE